MCELLEGRPDISRDPAKAFQMAARKQDAFTARAFSVDATLLARAWDLHRGLELGRDSTLAGSAYGEFVVAFAYENGPGVVERDFQEYVEHYKLAVQHGIAEAQYRLAHVLE
jgi:TPR repeat protein